ncbi:imidazole glycerol phosphate synthase subunit HisH [Bermanella marisrubri]|uniref:Imidazole glycerol phosphate synthase subunit HisH n=1 Tax=Bermanella marisrubri TaxID=207949 RepID=Q1N448_9GAMM|nr:imidazole glycerol phosphate synthase subunit HisH [Bermanella marisrubri]EAT13017.1 imidazole glycerol phosphate synthase subunit HisH [Oceanobacter sp. RED65] [Bermanella marisrubri]QIZ82856.1 imidazole glycerol phosphate synthase subunit HisH [Bermanella marisrubri]
MSSKQCAVIDYGMGNLHSASKALEHVSNNTEIIVTSDPETILKSDHVVLPGVGAMRDCMAEIKRLGVDQVVAEVVKTKPLLGICVGMQALMNHSEENQGVDCLGHFPGEVKFFGRDLEENGEKLKVPHMGWNQVQQIAHPMWHNIEDNSRFYFVHSFYVEAENQEHVKGRGHYGKDFVAAIAKDNVFAVQFHPEKSHTSGLQLLQNFLQWDGQN